MPVQASGKARRFGATLALFVFMFGAWGSGLDRMSGSSPALERLVPPPFRAEAERSSAATALAHHETSQGRAFAEQAVLADPLAPAASALLGSARKLGGDEAGAKAAYRVAGTLGWREESTQLYWYDTAIRAGDLEQASRRADALLRANPQFEGAANLLTPLEEDPKGRTALVDRLVRFPAWTEDYFYLPDSHDDALLHRRAEIAIAVAARGAALGCDSMRALTEALLRRGAWAEARAVWRANCPGAEITGGFEDSGFEMLAGAEDKSPFGWQRHNQGDLFLGFEPDGRNGHMLSARNAASVSRLLVSQATGFAPGRYRMRADIRSNGKPAPGRVVASLDCGGEARRPALVAGDLAGDGQWLTIGACVRQQFGLWLRPGDDTVSIDNLTVEPAK